MQKTLKKKKKTERRKTLKNKTKEKRKIQGKENNKNKYLSFYLLDKNYALLENII